ncbi:glycosyltransferase, partial [Rhodopirellula baltica WH47]
MGTATNLHHLNQLILPFRQLRKKHRFDFVVCSDVKNEGLLNELEASFERWSAEREIQTLQSFDIGLMPLSNEDWCLGKCAFKLIQYLAVGIATVSSAVGMNMDVVSDGDNGFLAYDENWAEPLDQLLSDCEARRRMGK